MSDKEIKDPDLIDRREFRKRQKIYFEKHREHQQELFRLAKDDKFTVGRVFEESAQKFSTIIALKFENRQFTYKELNELINQFAHYFISLGVKKGDIINIIMKNSVEMLATMWACAKIGCIASLINHDLREKSLIHVLRITLGKVIIVDEECLESFTNIKDELELPNDIILCFSPYEGDISCPNGYENLPQVVKSFPVDNPSTVSEVEAKDILFYLFTSGTTGLPKAVPFIHKRTAMGGRYMGKMLLDLTEKDILYECLPIFHGTALNSGVSASLSNGATLVLARKFSVSQFWDDIRKYNATAFNYVGELCRYLLNQPPKPNDADNLVRTITGNGLRPEIWMEFKKRFNIERIGEFYGATETARSSANIFNFDRTAGYMGGTTYAIVKFDPEEEVAMRNEKGFMEKVRPGGTGLLIFPILSEDSFAGYLSKKATEKKILHDVFKKGDRWINTGDLIKDLGCHHIAFVDRLGDTFRWKSHNISTTEVEEVINVHEHVMMSSVYGIKIPGTDGRAGMALIIPTVKLEEFDFKGFAENCLENLPPYAVPIFLRFRPNMEITVTFRLKKAVLKKESYNIGTKDPLYIMLPRESSYTPLTKDIYEDIQNGKFTF